MVNDSLDGFSLYELAALEACERALSKAKNGRRFDPEIFQAVAEMEAKKLRKSL